MQLLASDAQGRSRRRTSARNRLEHEVVADLLTNRQRVCTVDACEHGLNDKLLAGREQRFQTTKRLPRGHQVFGHVCRQDQIIGQQGFEMHYLSAVALELVESDE